MILVRRGWGVYGRVHWRNLSPVDHFQPTWRYDIKSETRLTWKEGLWEIGNLVSPGSESYDEAHNGIPNDWGIGTYIDAKLMLKVDGEQKEVWRETRVYQIY